MDKGFEKKYHDVETDHWWFRSRRKYITDLLKDAPKDSKILDIGCSSGILLNDLESLGFAKDNLYGIDISENAIKNCHKNGIPNAFVMDAQNITLTEKFDIIIASDNLEHLEKETQALLNWKDLLKPNGKMYVFVPAFMSLWSYHDEVNMHYRRYTKNELKTKLAAQDLKIVKAGYWNFSLFPPVYIFRKLTSKLKNKSAESDINIGNRMVNNALLGLVSIENKLLRVVSFPFGVSTFCIAQKVDEVK
jgi:SAM-dependent methyltransferase